MKKLIVSGCSYTAKEFLSSAYPDLDTSWPKWPELLGKKLNMKVVNLAQDGAGNRFILQTLLDKIERTSKDKIGLVMAAWSQANRDDWQTGMPISKWSNNRIKRPGDIYGWVRESLLGYITLQNVCKRYNIPYKQFQMIGLFEPWLTGLKRTEADQLDLIKRGFHQAPTRYEPLGNQNTVRRHLRTLIDEYEQFIDTDNFIGFQNTNYLNGLISVPIFQFLDINEYTISKLDEHPSKKGHEEIARLLYDRLG
jgi:hypothetical protein|tara:strand:- start:52 stop:807 length:756 start_codon:yes stop_codon:yes gene_type:complete